MDQQRLLLRELVEFFNRQETVKQFQVPQKLHILMIPATFIIFVEDVELVEIEGVGGRRVFL